MPGLTLAIEVSNPSSGPRGAVRAGEAEGAEGGERTVLAGPGVALRSPIGGADLVESLHEGSRHDDDLMPAIDRLFRRAGARPRDLGAVAVSIGPGGYTALRIAVATAKMLAEATGAATIPVPSALVAAYALGPGGPAAFPALVCLASKGPATHATLLATQERGRWAREAVSCGLIEAGDLERLRPRALVADAFLPKPIHAAAASLGIPVIEPLFTASAVLELAAHIAPVDPVALAPLYPREPEAVALWRSRREERIEKRE